MAERLKIPRLASELAAEFTGPTKSGGEDIHGR
jgi:hypothetical protein